MNRAFASGAGVKRRGREFCLRRCLRRKCIRRIWARTGLWAQTAVSGQGSVDECVRAGFPSVTTFLFLPRLYVCRLDEARVVEFCHISRSRRLVSATSEKAESLSSASLPSPSFLLLLPPCEGVYEGEGRRVCDVCA